MVKRGGVWRQGTSAVEALLDEPHQCLAVVRRPEAELQHDQSVAYPPPWVLVWLIGLAGKSCWLTLGPRVGTRADLGSNRVLGSKLQKNTP